MHETVLLLLLNYLKNARLSSEKHFFFSFCFHPTTVICLQRFYEVSGDKKPECGMEMGLVALGDWLRLSTDANTPPVAPSVFL